MKQSQLVIILLIVLGVMSWGAALMEASSGKNAEYREYMELADEYMERTLFQKAIEEYKNAAAIKEEEDIWETIMTAYELQYKEMPDIYDDYVADLETAVRKYPKNKALLTNLIELYIEEENYESAHYYLKKAMKKGVSDEKIEQLHRTVRYAYDIGWHDYEAFLPCVNDNYAVCVGGSWMYISETGEEEMADLQMAGLIGDDEIRVAGKNNSYRLIDEDEVAQGILSFVPTEAGMYAEGLIALHNGTHFSYYNSLGDKVFGEFDYAAAFSDGMAAVKDGDKWYFIDGDGEKVSSKEYEDIVINADKTAMKEGIILAKIEGNYVLLDEDEKKIGDFSCDAADIVTEDRLIAFSKGGKWGYADEEGDTVIEPSYEGAKSFSNGLAAVSNGTNWGFIDTNNTLVIDYIFQDADYFNEEGCCMVQKPGEDWQLLSLYINE
uniref:WG repeat-containing protein n=1 Tax=Agathobacter sp. TaxID=2021311 RepID=UPI0040574C96